MCPVVFVGVVVCVLTCRLCFYVGIFDCVFPRLLAFFVCFVCVFSFVCAIRVACFLCVMVGVVCLLVRL